MTLAIVLGDINFKEMREMVFQFAAHSGWLKSSLVQATVDEMHSRIIDQTRALDR